MHRTLLAGLLSILLTSCGGHIAPDSIGDERFEDAAVHDGGDEVEGGEDDGEMPMDAGLGELDPALGEVSICNGVICRGQCMPTSEARGEWECVCYTTPGGCPPKTACCMGIPYCQAKCE